VHSHTKSNTRLDSQLHEKSVGNRLVTMELNYRLFILLYGSVRFIVMWTCLFPLLRYRGILICNITLSLRLLVPSSPQVRRPSSCSLIRPARSRRSGGAAVTARTVRQVHAACSTFHSSAASSYAVVVLSPLISPSKALSPEMTGSTALPTQLPPVPMALDRPRPR
jgi:hypothetical protein